MTTKQPVREYPLYTPELIADPYGCFGRIREDTPIARGRQWDGSPVWVITRHDDVSTVLTDRRFASNSRSLPGSTTDAQAEFLAGKVGIPRDLVPFIAGNLAHLDPPDHTRLRKLVSRAFSARRISLLRPRVEAITDELLDALPGHAGNGAVDLIEHFASPLPIRVVCELLGVPAEDKPRWGEWSRDYTSKDARRLNTMLAEISAHIHDLVERRRAEPAGDLITALIQAHDQDSERLSDTELVTMVLTLMIAGHETTTHLVGNGTLALLTHPDQLALLRADPTLMPGAVQELLRWCSPVVVAKLRYAMEDVTIGDTLIQQGDRVQVVLGAANHDPRRFPQPEVLDVTRRPDNTVVHHLAYALGSHYCLGAALANQEAEVAFAALFTRYPQLALAVPAQQLQWQPIHGHRALVQLPVALGTPS
ncbi:MAG TPA: cytochrome P450 [Micromonosporaceae bacterium]|nr:cytochrome P450 [Micromonosporaceae bacterium]